MSFKLTISIVWFIQLKFILTAYSGLKIRMAGGENINSGRLEVYHPLYGWGTVCRFDFNGADAWNDTKIDVVSRQFGLNGTKGEGYGDSGGSGPIYCQTLFKALVTKQSCGIALTVDGL